MDDGTCEDMTGDGFVQSGLGDGWCDDGSRGQFFLNCQEMNGFNFNCDNGDCGTWNRVWTIPEDVVEEDIDIGICTTLDSIIICQSIDVDSDGYYDESCREYCLTDGQCVPLPGQIIKYRNLY